MIGTESSYSPIYALNGSPMPRDQLIILTIAVIGLDSGDMPKGPIGD